MAGKALRRNHSFIWSNCWGWSPNQPSRPGLKQHRFRILQEGSSFSGGRASALTSTGTPQATLSVYNVHLSPSLLPGQNECLMDLKDVTFCFETEM